MKNKLWDLDVEEIPCSECPYSKITKFTTSMQGYTCTKHKHDMVGNITYNNWGYVSVNAYSKNTKYCEHLADYFMAGNDIFRKIWNSKIL